jgi:MFS family permease
VTRDTAQLTAGASTVSAGEVEALHRRALRVLMTAQLLGGAGLAAGVTVGALLAEDMLGSTRLSGLPAGLLTLGSAGAALLIGQLSQRSGRRPGLAAGYLAGAVGGAGVVAAAALDSVALLMVSLLVYGAGTATNLQSRYAGADLAPAGRRGASISSILVATTVGAVAGPNLVEPTGRLATALGLPALSGPFLLATVAYATAGLVLLARLRPDPLLTARALARGVTDPGAPQPGADGRPDPAALRLGAIAMVLTQVVMVAVMTMTPVHMVEHHHGLAATGLVIGVHIAAMYLPSPVTGRLADRCGARPVLAAGGLALLAAGVLAAVAPGGSVALLALALALLGLGWNLGLLGGTTLVTAAVPVGRRARTQGRVDLAVALAGAAGGTASGMVTAASSYAALGLGGAALALVVVLVAARPSRPPGAGAAGG